MYFPLVSNLILPSHVLTFDLFWTSSMLPLTLVLLQISPFSLKEMTMTMKKYLARKGSEQSCSQDLQKNGCFSLKPNERLFLTEAFGKTDKCQAVYVEAPAEVSPSCYRLFEKWLKTSVSLA